MKIEFTYQKHNRKFNYSTQAQQLIYQIISKESKRLEEISIVFTDNAEILAINKSFLNHLYYTDVITFNYSKKNLLKGDIFISLEQVTANASLYKTTPIEELFRVIVHGVLHLIGYNDQREEEKKMMRLKEDQYLCIAKEFVNLKSDESII